MIVGMIFGGAHIQLLGVKGSFGGLTANQHHQGLGAFTDVDGGTH